MKVYFTASLRGVQFYKEYYEKIFHFIEKLGHTHLDKEILTLNSVQYYSELEYKGHDADVDLYNRKMRTLQQADVCIFESSFHSLSIGFQIEKALYYLKPTIVLYLDNNKPHFLEGIENEKLIISAYKTSNVHKVLRESIAKANKKKEQRFNFFLSPELLTYLEETSKKKGLTKSRYIRSLIEQARNGVYS